MQAVGIICEFNPFHNGHQYLIQTLRHQTGADGVICVMSGNWMQRGQPALWDKWARTRMALAGGADLVLELPVCCVVQSAERFARGGVALLNALGVVRWLGFGSETGELAPLAQAARNIAADGHAGIKQAMKDGVCYPTARSRAVAGMLSHSNDILGVEYLRAIERQNARMEPIVIQRKGAAHDSDIPVFNIAEEAGFASASYLRRVNAEERRRYMPLEVVRALEDCTPIQPEGLSQMLLYRLRIMSAAELTQVADVAEGLENRIAEGARVCTDAEQLRQFVKSKRYTMTRIDRILVQALLGITKPLQNTLPQYVRVLGMNQVGCELLRQMKSECLLPVITKTADAQLAGEALTQFQVDVRATDIYALLREGENRRGGQDYTIGPVVVP